jgi:predicted NAD-dependent protein-ADP-ribosyltransferase YbiA (DUF1768 family)
MPDTPKPKPKPKIHPNSLANLRPARTTEEARELGRRSGQARRERRKKAEELALRDLVPLSLKAHEKALRAYLAGHGDAHPALRAADSVLDREWGKPTQRIEQAQADEPATEEALRARYERMRAELERVLSGQDGISTDITGPDSRD